MKRAAVPALALILLAALAPSARSQTKTIVSATVVDPNGVPYAGGTVATQLMPTGGTPTINNVPVNVQNNPAAIDANGHFTISLWCNTAGGACTPFDQVGTQWQFTITNPGAQPPVGFGGVSFTVSVTITGTTQDISSTLNAAAVLLYRDSGASGGNCPGGAAGDAQFSNGTKCTNAAGINSGATLSVDGSGNFNMTSLTGFLNLVSGADGENGFFANPSQVTIDASEPGSTIRLISDQTVSLLPGTSLIEQAATSITRSAPTITDTVGSAAAVTPGSVTQRSVTTTTDTILSTDRQNRVVYNSASAVAVSLPANGTAGFSGGMNFRISDQNAGAVTVTPAAGTINGNATLVLAEGQDCLVTPSSPPGTNYAADCNEPQMTAGAGISLTRGVHSLTIATSGGTISGLTTGFLPKAASATSLANSLCDEGITTASTFTCAELAAFSGAAAASTPSVLLNGAPFTGGSTTTNVPQLYINQTGNTAPSTWSGAGTLLGGNAPTGFTGNFLDFHVNGGASLFALGATSGSIVMAGNIQIGGSGSFTFGGNAKILSNGSGNILLESNGGGALSRLVLGNDANTNPALCNSGTTVLVGQASANCTTLTGLTTGTLKGNLYATGTNCSSAASPAVCAAAAAGSVAVPTGTNPTLTVNTTAVTASSQIFLEIDEGLSTKLSVTCNSTLATLLQPVVTARTAGTSFTIQIPATIAANPVCVSYTVLN